MTPPDLAAQLDAHRGYLLRVARLQLRDEALAEDVVQDTLLAALSGKGFAGKSSLKTWLTGILKHKIVDAIRRKQRAPAAVAAFGDIDDELDIKDFDPLFAANVAPGRRPPPTGAIRKPLSDGASSSMCWTSASASCRRTPRGCS
jgi:RNA polymerase sigma factor (sigma-70 family)